MDRPYTIAEMDGVNATIVKGRKFIKVPVNRLKPFFYERRDRDW